MSSAWDIVPEALDQEEWPPLPTSWPVFDAPREGRREDRVPLVFHSLHFYVDPAHPDRTSKPKGKPKPEPKPEPPPQPTCLRDPDKRCWEDETTFDEWRKKEMARDTHFVTWKKTFEGRQEVEKVYRRFQGLRKTTLEKNDVSWFVREMSMADSYLREQFDSAQNKDTVQPPFSDHQLILLMLLSSPSRSLSEQQVCEQIKVFFGFYRGNPEVYGELSLRLGHLLKQARVQHDCLFPFYGYLEGSLPGWDRGPECEKLCASLYDTYTLPPGEENRVLTARYGKGLPLHYKAPPVQSTSRLGKETPTRLIDLPEAIFFKVLNNILKLEGPVILTMPAHYYGAFKAEVAIPKKRLLPGRFIGWQCNELSFEARIQILQLRLVNREWSEKVLKTFFANVFVLQPSNPYLVGAFPLDDVWAVSTTSKKDRYGLSGFKIRFNPYVRYWYEQDEPVWDHIDVSFHEETVLLGASQELGRLTFGTPTPWWKLRGCVETNEELRSLNETDDELLGVENPQNYLFRDPNGHLAIRVFVLRLGVDNLGHVPQTWLGEIFRHLYQQTSRTVSPDHAVWLDWNSDVFR